MISYCVLAYRPVYDYLLIEELIRKTSVPYEILVWINTPDEEFYKWLLSKAARYPIIVVGRSPENIGMNGFKPLFERAKYELITQLDDDVICITSRAAQIAHDIFQRYPRVKQLVADVWQDDWTNGGHPALSDYKPYAEQDGLYDGPIDGGFTIYHRSILPHLLKSPFDKYFYLGAHIRLFLDTQGFKALLCTKMKMFHVSGPYYHAAFGMLDFEIEKYRAVGHPEIAKGLEEWKDKLPSKQIMEDKVCGVVEAFMKL